MRRLWPLLIALLLLTYFAVPTFARRAIAHVQTCGSTVGDDQTMTCSAAVQSGNHLYIVVSMALENQTISITDTTMTFNTSMGPTDSSGFTIRSYVFCAPGDGVDTTFIITTSSTGNANAHGAEFSGGSCTLDGTARSNDDTDDDDEAGTGEYTLTTDVTVSGSDSLLLGYVRSDSAANFDPGTSFTQFGTDGQASAAQYRILTASGSFDTPFNSAATENALLVGIAFQAASAATTRTTLLMGCCR